MRERKGGREREREREREKEREKERERSLFSPTMMDDPILQQRLS